MDKAYVVVGPDANESFTVASQPLMGWNGTARERARAEVRAMERTEWTGRTRA